MAKAQRLFAKDAKPFTGNPFELPDDVLRELLLLMPRQFARGNIQALENTSRIFNIGYFFWE